MIAEVFCKCSGNILDKRRHTSIFWEIVPTAGLFPNMRQFTLFRGRLKNVKNITEEEVSAHYLPNWRKVSRELHSYIALYHCLEVGHLTIFRNEITMYRQGRSWKTWCLIYWVPALARLDTGTSDRLDWSRLKSNNSIRCRDWSPRKVIIETMWRQLSFCLDGS